MKLLSLFTGIGAFEKALKNIGIDYELVGFSEIDKYAAKSYCAVHNVDESLNLGDITKIEKEKLPRFIDLITHGSPCQDFSIAGKQEGGDKGTETRSSLMWNTVDIVEWCLPKYVVWENVKNILSKKHKHNFDSYIEIMDKLGYNSYYQVLNAKNYGIPQNRERVYTISIRKDIDTGFEFPEPEELKLRLKDILEKDVDEKYYLDDKKIEKIKSSTFAQERLRIQEKDYCDTILARDWKDPKCVQIGKLDIKGHDCVKHVYSGEGISPTLTDMQGGNRQPKIMTVGNYMPSNHDASRIVDGEGIAPTVKENHGTVTAIIEGQSGLIQPIDRKYKEHKAERKEHIEFKDDNCSHALRTSVVPVTCNNLRIRKLTPKECWRLMGFTDEDFEKAQKVPMSNTQLYKQARKLNSSKCIRKNI